MDGVKMLIDKVLEMTLLIDTVTLARALTFAEMAKKVVEAIKTGATAFKELGKFGEATETKGAESVGVMNAFKDTLHSLIQELIGWVPPQTQQLGLAVVQGVATGITNNAKLIHDALLAAITSAMNAAKALLQIASPSQVFADQIGAPIAEGIMLGVQAKALQLSDTVGRVASAGLNNLQSTSTTYQVNATYPYQEERSVRSDLEMLTMLKGKR
jgi:hypothetical protein